MTINVTEIVAKHHYFKRIYIYCFLNQNVKHPVSSIVRYAIILNAVLVQHNQYIIL